jgi:predicted O-methyltransferase YrrM
MKNITDEIIEKANLPATEEARGYYRFDSGSGEVEVLEFLYSLVRLIKPDRVCETGSYKGLSGAYLAMGLRDNRKGHLDSIEWEAQHVETAKKLWDELGLTHLITEYQMSSLDFKTDKRYELILLDTEPQLRFKELERFWDNILPGGIIVIHDLSWDLGIGAPQFWLHKEILDNKIKDHELYPISFLTPRGLTIFQKFDPTFESFKLWMP